MTHEAGKGDKTRPTNWDHFSENFDRIFGNSKHYKKDSLERQVLEDQIAPYTKELDEKMIGNKNDTVDTKNS